MSFQQLVIGYGSTLRGDDALGVHAVEQMEAMWADDAGLPASVRDSVQFVVCHQLTPELVEPLARSARVILIDARAGTPPGVLTVERVQADETVNAALTHDVTPQALLLAARILYGTQPEMWLVSVTAASFAFGEQLSPAVQAMLPALLDRVTTLLRRAVDQHD